VDRPTAVGGFKDLLRADGGDSLAIVFLGFAFIDGVLEAGHDGLIDLPRRQRVLADDVKHIGNAGYQAQLAGVPDGRRAHVVALFGRLGVARLAVFVVPMGTVCLRSGYDGHGRYPTSCLIKSLNGSPFGQYNLSISSPLIYARIALAPRRYASHLIDVPPLFTFCVTAHR